MMMKSIVRQRWRIEWSEQAVRWVFVVIKHGVQLGKRSYSRVWNVLSCRICVYCAPIGHFYFQYCNGLFD